MARAAKIAMRPLREFPLEALRKVSRILFDIDDTLTTDGRLTTEAFAAMECLYDAGLKVVPITGRPAGWCDHFARMWPVTAVVGENGAFYFLYDRKRRVLERRFWLKPEERAESRRRFEKLAKSILAKVPGSALSADQPYRECDLAIDYREDVAPLAPKAVDKIVALMEAAGANAKISSIHVNGWFGDYDKLAMTKVLFRERFGASLNAEKKSVLFVGDSPNDVPMFRFFPNAVGVANVLEFEDRLAAKPAYVATLRAGAGFAEIAGLLLTARS